GAAILGHPRSGSPVPIRPVHALVDGADPDVGQMVQSRARTWQVFRRWVRRGHPRSGELLRRRGARRHDHDVSGHARHGGGGHSCLASSVAMPSTTTLASAPVPPVPTNSVLILLVLPCVLLLAARLLGSIALRVRLPRIVGELS